MSKKQALTTEDYKYLLEYMQNDNSIRDLTKNKFKKIFTMLFYTGARISEILSLKQKDLQSLLKKEYIRLLTNKTKRLEDGWYRDVPLSATAIEDIKKDFEDCIDEDSETYCIKSWGRPTKKISTCSINTQINKYLKSVFKDKDISSHSFRSGLIIEMSFKHNRTDQQVSAFIGHTSLETTKKYLGKSTARDLAPLLCR
jgi:integrase